METMTIDLESGAKIIVYPVLQRVHFIFPYVEPLTLTLKQAIQVCLDVAKEKRLALASAVTDSQEGE